MKRIATLLMVLALCISSVALFASCGGASVDETAEFIFGELKQNGTVVEGVCSVAPGPAFSASGKIEIPAEAPDGRKVTKIASLAFRDYANIKEVVLPETVEVIDNFAFDGCTGLKTINLPESLKMIGNYAFDGCTDLTEIELPSKLEYIGIYAFRECASLESISLPDTLEFYDGAFYNCTGLTSITFGAITTIGEGSFHGCTKLQELVLPETLIEIRDFAFEGCTNLKGSDHTIEGETVKVLDIPESVIAIGNGAFMECRSLSYVDFQTDKVSTLVQAFYNCTSLTEVKLPAKIQSLGEAAFFHCEGLTGIVIPTSVKFFGENLFGNCTALNDIIFSDGKSNETPTGSRAEWNAIQKPDTSKNDQTTSNKVMAWNNGVVEVKVHCKGETFTIKNK